ncbi:MAG: HAMP domain-containing histidine kinase [Alphaproteobacteria bacterium]|nr:HAMP domain-containing histidine kinase [Alphaproteobacteria bacterium]
MSVGAIPVTQSPDPAAQIEREKIRLAYGTWILYVDGIPFALGLTVLMCGLMPAVGTIGIAAGTAWFACALIWAAGSSLAYRFYRDNEAKRSASFWRAQLAAIWVVHALVWGSTLFVFWDQSNTINQAILSTILLGVIVSYFFSMTMYFPVLLATLATITLVQSAAFLVHGGALAHVFMVVFPLFVCVLMNYGLKAAKSYHVALQLRFENEALLEAVTRANRAKSSFLASMSHELRTPLNAIIGYSDLMRQRTFGPIAPARYADYVDDIHSSGEHLLKMINDLLDLAKIEAGKRELNFALVDLSDIAKDAIRLVEPQAGRAHVAVMIDMKDNPIVHADERALKQIAINLLSNAVKFSRPGGIAVVFCERLPHGGVAFGVKDTGIGMTEAMKERAVKPFEQDSDAYTVEGRGTGLGLPICKGLIEAHQGNLRIESTHGIGSKIWAEFPVERVLRRSQAA